MSQARIQNPNFDFNVSLTYKKTLNKSDLTYNELAYENAGDRFPIVIYCFIILTVYEALFRMMLKGNISQLWCEGRRSDHN